MGSTRNVGTGKGGCSWLFVVGPVTRLKDCVWGNRQRGEGLWAGYLVSDCMRFSGYSIDNYSIERPLGLRWVLHSSQQFSRYPVERLWMLPSLQVAVLSDLIV